MFVWVEKREEKRKKKESVCMCTFYYIHKNGKRSGHEFKRELRGMENRRIWKETNEGWKLHNKSTHV